jgi:dTDP-glucose pyrophosphorylase
VKGIVLAASSGTRLHPCTPAPLRSQSSSCRFTTAR